MTYVGKCSFLTKLLYLGNNCLECLRVVNSEVSEDLTVNLNTSLVKSTHQLRVAESLKTSCSIDTLNPQCAECAFLFLRSRYA